MSTLCTLGHHGPTSFSLLLSLSAWSKAFGHILWFYTHDTLSIGTTKWPLYSHQTLRDPEKNWTKINVGPWWPNVHKVRLMSPFMKIISAFSILFRGLYTHDFFAAQYKRARNMTWRLYRPCVIVVNTLVSNLKPFTWFFNKWKQIEIIKIHGESHEHKLSFMKWIEF